MGGRLLILLLLVACAQEQIEVVEESVTQLNDIGVMLAGTGNDSGAKIYFEKVLDKNLAHETARKNLALINYKEGDYEKAIEHYKYLIDLNPYNPSYHYDLAVNIADNCRLNQVCDLPRAISGFERADELEPGYQNAKQNIAALREVMLATGE